MITLVGFVAIYFCGISTGLFLCGLTATWQEEGVVLTKESPPTSRIVPSVVIKRNEDSSNKSHIQRLKPTDLKLPTPILVMGMMKAGTTSIFGYFRCGLQANYTHLLSHYDCKPPDTNTFNASHIGLACGRRVRRNVQHYKYDAFKTIKNKILYAELDAQENNGGITLPQWSFLNEIHMSMPNATWILNLRNPQEWLQSIDRWKDLRQRLVNFQGGDDFPRKRGLHDHEMIDFYNIQAQRIRNFVQQHPSHTLVEVPIDQPNAGQIMETAFGITSECWEARNVYNGSAKWDLS